MCTPGLWNMEMITKPSNYQTIIPNCLTYVWLPLQDLAVPALGSPICTFCYWRGPLVIALFVLGKLSRKGFLLPGQRRRFTGSVSGLSVLNNSCDYLSPRGCAWTLLRPSGKDGNHFLPISRLRAGEASNALGAEWVFSSYVAMPNSDSDRTVSS